MTKVLIYKTEPFIIMKIVIIKIRVIKLIQIYILILFFLKFMYFLNIIFFLLFLINSILRLPQKFFVSSQMTLINIFRRIEENFN